MEVLLNNPEFVKPIQMLGQAFGLDLNVEDMLTPLTVPSCHRRPFVRSHNVDTTVRGDDKFSVNMDVQQFAPEELKVAVVDNCIVVEGTHDEKKDEHGYISRQFKRRYVVPEGHDIGKIETKLSSDGVLTVTAPKIGESRETVIPITHTGQPHTAPEKKD